MKQLFQISFLLFLMLSNLMAQFPDTIIVKTERVKGYGPFPYWTSLISELPDDNYWKLRYPKYQGIPTELNNMLFAVEQTDFVQFAYYNYKIGKISEEEFQSLKEAWDWEPNDNEDTEDNLKLHIGIVAGCDENNLLKIKVDANNNYDFSDDEYLVLPEKMPNEKSVERVPIEVSYEYFDGNTRKSKTWIEIDQANKRSASDNKLMDPIQLSFAFVEHHVGQFSVNGNTYQIAIKSDRAVFRGYYTAKIWDKESEDKLSSSEPGIQNNGHVLIGDYFYKLGKANKDGSQVLLIKDQGVMERGGTEVGMTAINFTAQTLDGGEIELKNLKGKVVLLDFWGTWCKGCIPEIPILKSINEKFKNEDFLMIGIALDKQETLKKFIELNSISWPQIFQDEDKTIISDYNIVGYPATFLINKEGKIVAKHLHGEELSIKIEEVLSE